MTSAPSVLDTAFDADHRRNDLEQLRERLREAEDTLSAIRNGDVDAVVVAGVDGTPKIYTLETADQSYRVLVEQMEEGALTLGSDGIVLFCNRKFANMVTLDAGGITGAPIQEFIAEKDTDAFNAALAAGSGRGECGIRTADGRVAPAYYSFAPLNDGSSDPVDKTYSCIITDLTEQRRTGEALRVAHARLLQEVQEREHTEMRLRQSQKMQAVGQLTGGVAHDFNNLLMVISAGLDMLSRQPDETRRKRLQDEMRKAVQRGATLTRQLLTFSRQHALNPQPCDLVLHVETMRELLDRSLGGDISVATDFAKDLWPIYVDTGELELVILNLCVNARDAMPNGGTITIGGHNLPGFDDGELRGDFVCVTVADTGSGMPEDVVSRAFEPFYTTKEIGKGSGLGLAQTYGFAQESHGRASIHSEVGVGTTISIMLPKSLEQPRPVKVKAGESDFSGKIVKPSTRGNVLLVEDDNEVAALTSEMLSSIGYQVIRVASADAALGALADGRNIDVLYSDVMMPGGMNGVDLAREVRKRRTDLPILLASGHAERVKVAATTLGLTLLEKPYRLEQLEAALLSATGAAR